MVGADILATVDGAILIPNLSSSSVNAGYSHSGFAWLMRRIKSRISAAMSGLPGRRRDFLVQYQAKALR